MTRLVDLKNIAPELQAGAREVCPSLGLKISSKGTPVFAKQGDTLSVEQTEQGIMITYRRKNEFFRALGYVKAVMAGESVCESGKYEMLCYMADMSRNAVFNMPSAKRMLRYLAAMGYDSMMLYTEDTYEVEEYPYFGHLRGRFTKEELRELDNYADMLGIEMIPCIQTLAHLGAALRWNTINKFGDVNDILLVGDDRTYEFIKACLKTVSECFRTRRVHIGMDEAWMLGLGKYLKQNGYRPAYEIMLEHLEKVAKMCDEMGYQPMMWSDMFFRIANGGPYYMREGEIAPEIRAKVPANIELVYWDYYSLDRQLFDHMVDCHLQFDNKVLFAGGAWKWYGFAPHNNFSLASTKLQLDSCAERGIGSVIVTGWGDNGGEASQFSVMPTMLYFAERLFKGTEVSDEHMEARSKAVFGLGYSELLLMDLPNMLPGTSVSELPRPTNPCKYLLYNDPLEGMFDRHMDAAVAPKHYAAAAKKLYKYAYDPSFGKAYKMLATLCDLLADKCDLTIRTRDAYLKNNRVALRKLASEDLPTIIAKLDNFVEAFREQWYDENRTFGFSVQEQRLGGLRMRLVSMKARLESYLDGEIESIAELEAPVLYIDGRAEDSTKSPYLSYNNWANNVSACPI